MSRTTQLKRKLKSFVNEMCGNKEVDFAIMIAGSVRDGNKLDLIYDQSQINKDDLPTVLMKLSEYIQLKEIADANKDRPNKQEVEGLPEPSRIIIP